VMAAVAALLLVSYLLSRQNIEGQVYTLNADGALEKVNGATLYVDSSTKGVSTNDQGAFTFSVWNAFPRRHRVMIQPPNTTGQFKTYWRGPWPFQSLWQDSVDFRYDPSKLGDERFTVARNGPNLLDRTLSALSQVVVAASRSPSEPAAELKTAAAASAVEIGFLVDTVSTPNLSGLPFFRAKRAFFKVWIDGRQLGDRDVLAAAPLTLGASPNVFPVESNRQSWIPVSSSSTKFANLLCRLPLDAVQLVDHTNHLIFGRDIVVQLTSGDGDMLGQFVLTRSAPYAIGQSVELADTLKKSSSLRIQPVVRIKPIDLKWTPNRGGTVRAGESLALKVASSELPPFAFEFSLTQSGSGMAAVENLPQKMTLSPSKSSTSLNLLFAPRPGKVKIVSHLPASLKRPKDDDDADVTVIPR
jgi:hypothetical protein